MVDLGARPADASGIAGNARAAGDLVFATSPLAATPGWRALADESANAFFAPSFAIPVLAALAPRARLATVADGAGRLVAAAPVQPARLGGIAPAVRVLAHDYGPVGEPLVADGRRRPALAALVDGLSPPGSGVSVVIPCLSLGDPVAGTLHAIAAASGRPVHVHDAHRRAMLERGQENVRASLPTRRRKEFARLLRRLDEHGGARFAEAVGVDAIAAFENYLALEAAGWKGRAGTALASRPATAAFARAAVANAAASGRVRVDTLLVAGRPAAMLVTFLSETTAFSWKIAYDEALAHASPGAQLMLEVPARIFAASRVTRIDSLATAGHPMIDHLWPGRMEVGTMVIGPADGGTLARAGLAVERLGRTAHGLARRLLRR